MGTAVLAAFATAVTAAPSEIAAALEKVRSRPAPTVEHKYVVTAGVRLGFFWISRRDIGLGRIRTGGGNGCDYIQLVLGSLPAKAPFRINRWGAATEIGCPEEGTAVFFGVMTPTKDDSLAAARGDIARDSKAGPHELQVMISGGDAARAVSSGHLMSFEAAWTADAGAEAESAALARLTTVQHAPRVASRSTLGCGRPDGLLFTVRELIRAGGQPPLSRCFVYHSRRYTLTLKESRRTSPTQRRLRFEILNHSTNRKSGFEMAVDESGTPVQIEYRPNWWFRLSLTLAPQ